MAKIAPSSVVVHRIEFQQKEREMLESLTASLAFNRVATPVVALMSDVTGMAVLIGLLAAAFPKFLDSLPPGWEETAGMTTEEVMDWLELQNIVGAGIGYAVAGPIGAAVGIVGVEAAEHFIEAELDPFLEGLSEGELRTGAGGTAFFILANNFWNRLVNASQGPGLL